MNKIQYQKLLEVVSKKAQVYAKLNIGVEEPAKKWTDEQINHVIGKISSGEYGKHKQNEEVRYGSYNSSFNNLYQNSYQVEKPQPRDIIFYLGEKLTQNTLKYNGALLDLALDFTNQAFEKVVNNDGSDYGITIKSLLKSVTSNQSIMDALKLDEVMLEKHFLEANLSSGPDNHRTSSLHSIDSADSGTPNTPSRPNTTHSTNKI